MRPKYPLKAFLVNSHLMTGKSFAYYYAMQMNKQKKHENKLGVPYHNLQLPFVLTILVLF